MSEIKVALVCDFFYPAIGGVEMHILQLSKQLKQKVNKIIVITHYTPQHYGIKYIEGVKVYYLAWHFSKVTNVIFATCMLEYPEARRILREERINVVHCHQTGSLMAMQYGLFASTLNIKVVHTEHSLYGYQSLSNICFNWLLKQLFKHYHQIICVSRATRNNVLLRTQVQVSKTVIIPNAVGTIELATARIVQLPIKIVVVGRLVYRRGSDLLIQVLPTLCERNANIQIKIIGDGCKLLPLKETVKQYGLQRQVRLYGALSNSDTLEIVKNCHIFLSTALTQSFGIALVEASTLGLYCLSTDVGGVRQILPPQRLHTVSPSKNQIIMKLEQIIKQINTQGTKMVSIDSPYSQVECSERVLKVYEKVLKIQDNSCLQSKLLKEIIKNRSLISVILLLFILIIRIMNVCLSLLDKKTTTLKE